MKGFEVYNSFHHRYFSVSFYLFNETDYPTAASHIPLSFAEIEGTMLFFRSEYDSHGHVDLSRVVDIYENYEEMISKYSYIIEGEGWYAELIPA